MSATTADVMRDLERLWGQEVRDFVHYIVETSVPAVTEEIDERVLAEFRECHANLTPPCLEILDLLVRHGLRPQPPAYGLEMGSYNYMRPLRLAEIFQGISARGQARLQEFAQRWAMVPEAQAALKAVERLGRVLAQHARAFEALLAEVREPPADQPEDAPAAG